MPCWIPIVIGSVMHVLGLGLILRFFGLRRAAKSGGSDTARTESMILGVLLTCVGPLLILLGAVGSLCDRYGVNW